MNVSSFLTQGTLDELADRSWTFFDTPELYQISQRFLKIGLDQEGLMNPALIGRGSEAQNQSNIRSDTISWQDFEIGSEPEQFISSLIQELNRSMFIGLQGFECHFSHYSNGGHYDWHIDQSRYQGANERIITFVFYLNTAWQESWGGELEIQGEIPIFPLGGRLVLFKSQTIEHQVRTSYHDRWSLTGWLTRSSLKRQ